jgi:hypothetical protein
MIEPVKDRVDFMAAKINQYFLMVHSMAKEIEVNI